LKKLGILLSGRGSNFEAIADSIKAGRLQAEIAIVISNRADAPGLESAKRRGLNAQLIPSKGRVREEHDTDVIMALKHAQVDLICLAGYMRLLSPHFIQAFPNRIVNIHPSLLPAFPGMDAQKQALDYGAKITGCTVHFVDEHLDLQHLSSLRTSGLRTPTLAQHSTVDQFKLARQDQRDCLRIRGVLLLKNPR